MKLQNKSRLREAIKSSINNNVSLDNVWIFDNGEWDIFEPSIIITCANLKMKVTDFTCHDSVKYKGVKCEHGKRVPNRILNQAISANFRDIEAELKG